ncbi:fumarylacetoacetase [Asticcacaulis sp. AND118]|uniref:fumarylacetoacetase n=1 Tax=Asticcacaulis sp. AND118 TaxID=2840468 RepID=UPI001CFFDC5E|nr:fumarylacetoacetase [Asticcacaulis sp. AND118]UDF04889.1 fumarylacetoacetase [Asticcacaulis sp. AND118]
MSKSTIDETHDPARQSWVASANGHVDFPIQNLPLGVFTPPGSDDPRLGTAIGDQILDLRGLHQDKLIDGDAAALTARTLNALFARPSAERRALRRNLSALLSDSAVEARVSQHLYAMQTCILHLPAEIGDYADFYVGIHHATAVGKLFRPDNPLLPNYKHVPIGYHGRASSIRVSGEAVTRPNGQTKAPDADAPVFGPSQRLDYELELGVFIGGENALGRPVPIHEASERIAGFCLLNDWSSRDVQAWEYQPLGPFLAKNFHSTISPWVITAEALAPFRTAPLARPEGDPAPQPYLFDAEDQTEGAYRIRLGAEIRTQAMRDAALPPARLAASKAEAAMYWTVAQIIAHHAVGGCNLRPGDLLGTGTLSGAQPDEAGSLLELTHGGKQPLVLPSGETRRFLEDGDELSLFAHAEAAGYVSIGFGACTARILPAPEVP